MITNKLILSRFKVFVMFVALLALNSCSTPKVTEQYHNHYEQTDTATVNAAIDSRMQSWYQQVDSFLRNRIERYSKEWYSRSNEKEITTETVTTATDSLGRILRTEQRTISRDINREQHQLEQRIISEMEQRLHSMIDSVDNVWQQRLDAFKANAELKDSIANIKKPVDTSGGGSFWNNIFWTFIGAISIIVFYIIYRHLHFFLRNEDA